MDDWIVDIYLILQKVCNEMLSLSSAMLTINDVLGVNKYAILKDVEVILVVTVELLHIDGGVRE